MKKTDELTYEAAMSQLEELAGRMDRGELTIDQIAEELRKAKSLIEKCKQKLTAADEEIKKILDSMGV